jgi:hypothetical protein
MNYGKNQTSLSHCSPLSVKSMLGSDVHWDKPSSGLTTVRKFLETNFPE